MMRWNKSSKYMMMLLCYIIHIECSALRERMIIHMSNNDPFSSYPDVVDVKQICIMLGNVSKKTVYRLLQRGNIEAFRVGRDYRVYKRNVLKYMHIYD